MQWLLVAAVTERWVMRNRSEKVWSKMNKGRLEV